MNNTTNAMLQVFNNIGVLQTAVPSDVFNNLKNAVENLPRDSKLINNYLLGHIKEEYSLNHIKDNMSDTVLSVANAWCNSHPGYIETFEEAAKSKNYELYLDTLWVNKQKKYEFNPMHHHAGILSFVIWVKIPYDLREEEAYFPPVAGETEENRICCYTSKFSFYYVDTLGRLQQQAISVDKGYEGTMIMFPSSLHHVVYPFYTSDDYRISVSGNIRLRVSDDKNL